MDDVDHHVRIHYTNYIHKLARRIGARQQVIATANVYFLRFFSRNGYRESPDPALVLSTCVYLATKTEECPVSKVKELF